MSSDDWDAASLSDQAEAVEQDEAEAPRADLSGACRVGETTKAGESAAPHFILVGARLGV